MALTHDNTRFRRKGRYAPVRSSRSAGCCFISQPSRQSQDSVAERSKALCSGYVPAQGIVGTSQFVRAWVQIPPESEMLRIFFRARLFVHTS